MIYVQHITAAKELQQAIVLIQEYAAELQENLCFQGLAEELANPLKKYGPPGGALYIAYVNDEPAGCVALQKLPEQGVCEMKRLYVRPQFRKDKIGQLLCDTILNAAAELGYTTMKLDTLDRLQPAISLYRKAGFTETTAYYANPLPGVVYMEKQLIR
jgi:putative acetyltransferase